MAKFATVLTLNPRAPLLELLNWTKQFEGGSSGFTGLDLELR